MEEFWGLVSAAKGTTGIVDQCIALFAFAGALSTAGFVLRYTQFLWRQFLRPAKSLKKYGKWAIVTGATDGIGREYCNFLAKQGAPDRPPRHLSALRSARERPANDSWFNCMWRYPWISLRYNSFASPSQFLLTRKEVCPFHRCNSDAAAARSRGTDSSRASRLGCVACGA